jgi:hypothetical protein
VNLLLHATDPAAPEHERAREWFEEQINGRNLVGLPWFTLVSFLRLSTQPGVRRLPLAVDEALEFVEDWLEWETVWTPEPTPRHHVVLAELLRKVPRTRLVNDAHIAALAIEHGLTLCSADADFKMLPGLRLHNPLE